MKCVAYSNLTSFRTMCAVVLCSGTGCQGQTIPKTNADAKREKMVPALSKAHGKEAQQPLAGAGGATAKKTVASRPGTMTISNNSIAGLGTNVQEMPPTSGSDDDTLEYQGAKAAKEQAPYTDMVTELADEDTKKRADFPYYKWFDEVINQGKQNTGIKLAVSAVSDRECLFVSFVAGLTFLLLPLSIAKFAATLGRKCSTYRPFVVSTAIGIALVSTGIIGPETLIEAAVYLGAEKLFTLAGGIVIFGLLLAGMVFLGWVLSHLLIAVLIVGALQSYWRSLQESASRYGFADVFPDYRGAGVSGCR